ncbi:MAG TPA: hypothetical protein VM328_10725 [Fimbriimonadaceae bacterium]|nr:hypothetical protein [Fimbriimonadaceae bacterium]
MTHALSLYDSQVVAHHDVAVRSVAFGRTRQILATADVRRQVRLWFNGTLHVQLDLRARHDRFRPIDHIRALAITPDEETLYVAAGETVQAYRTFDGHPIWIYHAPPTFAFLITSALSMAMAPSGMLAVAFDDGSTAFFDPEGRRSHDIRGNDSPRFIGFLQDGVRLVGSDGFSVGIWDGLSGRRLLHFWLTARIFGLAVSPIRDVFAIRTLREVLLFEVQGPRLLAEIPVEPGLPVVSFSSAHERLALVERHGLLVADYEGRTIMRIEQPEAAVLGAAFTPEGSIALAGSDGTVRLWDL